MPGCPGSRLLIRSVIRLENPAGPASRAPTDREGMTMTTNPAGATSDLLHALTQDLTTVLQQELRRAQQELADKARQAGKGGALLAGAGALGLLAAGTSAVLVVRVLDRFLPPRTSALIATGLYGAAAATLAAAGWKEIRESVPTTPREMVSNIREDLQAAHAGPSGTSPIQTGTGMHPSERNSFS
jgi:hypothetical protein